MPRLRKDCPICGKRGLLKLSNHLADMHRLSCEDRQYYLTQARPTTPAKDKDPSVVEEELDLQKTMKSITKRQEEMEISFDNLLRLLNKDNAVNTQQKLKTLKLSKGTEQCVHNTNGYNSSKKWLSW